MITSRSWFLILYSRLLVTCSIGLAGLFNVHTTATADEQSTKNSEAETELFRPKAGAFPPLEKAYSYRGELTFVDHANRRGSLRVQSDGKFRFISPNPFAMLPYGIVRYHGAPANLRDVPLSTMMHARAFLPPDLQTSSVPVLPVDNRLKKDGNAGIGSAPAENHVLLLEDEPQLLPSRRIGLEVEAIGNHKQSGDDRRPA